MREELLHFVWQFQKFSSSNLKTSQGEEVQIIHPGFHNYESGPDFLDARIRIGNTLWAGNVEIHVHAKDWFVHQHQFDDAYKNVILHVVYTKDEDQLNVPTIELKHRIPKLVIERFNQLQDSKQVIPCSSFLPAIDSLTWLTWKDRLLISKLEDKNNRIVEGLQMYKQDWKQVFYEQIAYNLGLSSNQNLFLTLAQKLPLRILSKHKNNWFQLEALLFGVANLLDSPQDEYQEKLAHEFSFLQSKYGLDPISPALWKFGRILPFAFPTIRIAQLASLLYHSQGLFSKLMSNLTLQELTSYFQVSASSYWDNHYKFGKTSRPLRKILSQSKIYNILINTVIPFLICYGRYRDKNELIEHGLQILREIPAEKNKIISKWKGMSIPVKHAFDSQAILFLDKNYCKHKKCLQCMIGLKVLGKSSIFES